MASLLCLLLLAFTSPFMLSSTDKVFLYEGFLSDEECDHLISLARGLKETTSEDGDVSGSIGMNGSFSSFSSTETPLNEEDDMATRIGERVSAWTFIPKGNGKPLQVMHYGLEKAEQDFDYYEPKNKIWSDCTKTNNILRPIKGNAILFFTRHLNASPDTSSSHTRCPVLDGDMWYAVKPFFVRAIDGVSVESDGSDCTE